jgi:hypothetical protein
MVDVSKPNPIVTIDMSPKKAPIGIKKYIKLVKKSLQSSPYYHQIYLQINTKRFLCEVLVTEEECVTYFLGSGNNVFMTLRPNGKGDIKTRGIDFETIEINGKKNKLDTIFYLRTFFYRMLRVKKIYISDVAHFLCKDTPPKEYNALMYRIFATDKPLNDVCIYQRYFYRITRKGDLSDASLEKMLKNYRTRYSKKFTDFDANCAIRADELDLLYTETLSKYEEFEKLYDSLSSFSALTKDSIYWPKDSAKSPKKSKNAKSRKKSR